MSALVQEMDWRQLGAKPILGPMMTKTLTPICGSWIQWVNTNIAAYGNT